MLDKKFVNTKRSQVWIETVIYTLIGLTVIGLLLAFATPKIEEIRDKAVLDQTKEALTSMDKTVSDLLVAPGNIRIVLLSLKKGELTFNAPLDTIEFTLKDSRVKYSEPNKTIDYGRLNLGEIKILTIPKNDLNDIKIWIDYSGMVNLSYNGNEEAKVFQQASSPYRFVFKNTGTQNIDVSLLNS